jgi:hypothetical protein
MAPKPIDFYLFDCQGLVVLRASVAAEQIAAARERIAAVWPDRAPPWKFPVLDLGEVFWDFLGHLAIREFARRVCGPHFRLDHAFGVCSHSAPPQMHGGADGSQGSCFYHWSGGDAALVGQLSIGVVLAGQSPQTGGLCYVPGSHKAFCRIDGRGVWHDYLGGKLDHPALVVPTLDPGDIVIFTESLVHGDTGWRCPERERLTAYYKFSPGWLAWRDPDQQRKYLPLARTDFERRLLEAPWSGRFHDDDHRMDVSNRRREETCHD